MTQNALAVIGGMKISTLAGQSKYAGQELGAGIAAPFAVIGYKGSRWSIRHRGQTTVLQRYDATGRPDGFVPFLDLVILFAASHHSKVYYAKNYQDGDDDIPDCWSTNGVVPDQAAPKKQSPQCATCKWNEFGSRVNQATGSKGKACADTRRMAVVPYQDIENTIMGGPMLLRVPPASLGSVGEYSDMLKANAVPYSAIATRVGFDPKEAYPRILFEPFAALTDEQMALVIKMQNHPLVERIVQEQMENMTAQPGSEQGVNVPPQDGSDPGPIPEALRRPPPQTQATQPAPEPPPVTAQVTPPNPNPFVPRPNGAAQATAATVAAQPQPQVQTPPAATAAQPAPPPAEVLTPEQLKIRELEEKLAQATAAAGKRPRKPRTPPVAPATEAQPAPPAQQSLGAAFGAAPPSSIAEIAARLPGETIVEADGEEDGSGSGAVVPAGGPDPALASITARLSKILT